ncbi:hypothetical protein VI26_02845 [Chromobacterium sp. LK1]|uniref:hypothetical protein n=1 Tax=Chromobacterium sp. LK1 TaxID=1628193 RepID=UPI000654797E|nr:hypothetical protein [Chromobacterium sp. LK1]KMN37579.1 hypothetical protein VI26_02845 [Chromobacterium sp. LK1]
MTPAQAALRQAICTLSLIDTVFYRLGVRIGSEELSPAEAWAETCRTFQLLDLQQRLPELIAELRVIAEPQPEYDARNMSALDYRIEALVRDYYQHADALPPARDS